MSNKEDAELSRLKSQTLIIKNAYQEEKKRNDQLQSDLDLKDDQILCLKNEIKELNNQNAALNKRINELIKSKSNNDAISRLNKMAINDKGSFTQEDFILLNSELSNKVQEMSKLHQEKDEQEMAMTLQISEFEQEILKLKEMNEDRLDLANGELQSALKKNKELAEEKANLEAKVIELFAELQSSKLEVDQRSAVAMFNGEENECESCKSKLLDAIHKMHYSESKAFSFEIECRSLQKRLEFSEKDLKDSLLENEELKTSIKNYVSHIQVMTEHIASLNDRIVSQREEIEDLKSVKNKKVGINKYLKI